MSSIPRSIAPKVRVHRRLMTLPRIGGLSVARRSISVAGAAASSMASNVSVAASSVVANASGKVSAVSDSMSVGVASASQGLASFARNSSAAATKRCRRPFKSGGLPILEMQRSQGDLVSESLSAELSKPSLTMRLPTLSLEERAYAKLPRLSLEGSESSRPPMCLHNVGLIRWIFEEARVLHLARPSYQARLDDTKKEKLMSSVILREVCGDILAATRSRCRAYRAVQSLQWSSEAARHKRDRVWCNLRSLRRKLFVAALFGRMLRDVREENAQAEQMWKQCCVGLGSWGLGSLGVSSKAFASQSLGLPGRSLGLSSFSRFRACGSISRGLRKSRNATENGQLNDSVKLGICF